MSDPDHLTTNDHPTPKLGPWTRSLATSQMLIRNIIIPGSVKCARGGRLLCSRVVFPCLVWAPRHIKREFVKIHNTQNWFKRSGMTLSSNAVGLIMAMSSTRLVEYFVEVREFGNLWGLLASRPVVSDTTFEVLNFLAEFLVALIVFTVTDHYYTAFRERHNKEE